MLRDTVAKRSNSVRLALVICLACAGVFGVSAAKSEGPTRNRIRGSSCSSRKYGPC